MKRLFVTALFCAAAAVSLFAGGSGEKGQAARTGKPIEVVFWHSTSGATGEALETIIRGYNEGPGKEKNIHANLVYQGYEGTDKVILAYQTKDIANAPDINQGLTSTIPSVMDMSWSVSAERFLTARNGTINKNTFYTALQRSCTYKGEMAAVPFANSIPLLYYNVDILREAGYDKPPETMDQLTEYVKKLTRKEGNNVSRYGLNMQTKRYQLVEFCVSQNRNAFFGDNEGGRAAPMTRITAGEDGTLRAFLEKLQKLLDTGGYKYVEDSINEEFAQGLSAMVIMSSSRIGTISRLMPGKYMTAFLPKVNPGDLGGAAVGGSCLSLFNRGDEDRLNAAWDVIQWCVSPESQYLFSTASGYIPVNTACESMPEMQAYYRENPQYKVALDQMKAASPLSQEPLDLTYNEINGIITEVMLEFCQGKLDVNSAASRIVALCNASLDEYHAAND
jgi:sn-glycerol 3-phosphate transport system substrate-binding protein